jgi:16S rRNA G527 N7-methylase RsmG
MSRALAPLSKLIDYVELFIDKSPSNKKLFPNMLFLKGKSYKKEILDLHKNKNLFFYEYPSLTDKYGKILYFDSSSVLKN